MSVDVPTPASCGSPCGNADVDDNFGSVEVVVGQRKVGEGGAETSLGWDFGGNIGWRSPMVIGRSNSTSS